TGGDNRATTAAAATAAASVSASSPSSEDQGGCGLGPTRIMTEDGDVSTPQAAGSLRSELPSAQAIATTTGSLALLTLGGTSEPARTARDGRLVHDGENAGCRRWRA